MKKQMKMIGFAAMMAFLTVANASAAPQLIDGVSVCGLIEEFIGVFKLLRTLAWLGAGFIIAGWAWGYISKPDDIKMDDVKKKGVSLLVGFVLLFSIGTFLTIITSAAGLNGMGCDILATGW